MELHSYAKRRASKKWNIEQKRKLVEARISYDSWFNSKPSNSVVPWKKVLSVAKLDDFNVFFVRKQWSNMLTKYKQYKQTRLDGIATNITIDTDVIQRINQEWEFFEAIHTFMTRKTTNLHSYAVTQKFLNTTITNATSNSSSTAITTIDANNGGSNAAAKASVDDGGMTVDEDGIGISLSRALEQNEMKTTQMSKEVGGGGTTALMKIQHDCVKENIPNNATILLQVAGTAPRAADDMQQHRHPNHHQHQYHHHHRHHIFSSDTNEEFEVICGAGETETDTNDIIRSQQNRNTDHDFYSKRMAAEAAAAVASVGGGVSRKFPVDERQLHYFADTSEESMGTEYVYQTSSTSQNYSLPSVMENIELHTEDGRTFEIKAENISPFHNMSSMSVKQENLSVTEMMPSTSTDSNRTNIQTQNPTSTSGMPSSTNKLTERDKYYRHKRRFNRRLEKRFDALLNVMGQVVKTEYPSVDIQPLMDSINCAASGLNGILSSESEDNDNDNCDDNKNTATANCSRPNET